MQDLLVIAGGAGAHDGLNPCMFVTCAAFIVYGCWLSSRSRRTFWMRFIFVFVYALGSVAFNFGPGQILILQKYFVWTDRVLYFVLGAWAFILGVLFFKDWLFCWRAKTPEGLPDERTKLFIRNGFFVFLTTVIVSLVLSALAALWPVNVYVMLLGNEAILKGQWQAVMPLLAGYVLMSMWPLWIVWIFLSIKNLRPSLLKIICAAIFFTASTSVILIFNGHK